MGFKLAGIMFIVMSIMGYAGYLYYEDTQARMAILVENNAKLNVAIQQSEEAVKSMQANIEKANQQVQLLNDEFAVIRRQNQELSNKLSEHDLAFLSFSKPTLVERIVNRASVKAVRCFELLSGAELTDSEKEATSAKQFNSECPWLFDNTVPN